MPTAANKVRAIRPWACAELSSDAVNRSQPTRKLRRRGMEQIDPKAAKKKITTGTARPYRAVD